MPYVLDEAMRSLQHLGAWVVGHIWNLAHLHLTDLTSPLLADPRMLQDFLFGSLPMSRVHSQIRGLGAHPSRSNKFVAQEHA